MSDNKDSSPKEFEFPKLHEEETLQPAPQISAPEPINTPAAEPEVASKSVTPDPTEKELLQHQNKFFEWFLHHKPAGLVIVFVVIAGLRWGINTLRNSSDSSSEDNQQNNAPDEIPVNIVEVRLGRFQDQINAVGTLKGEAEIELRFEVDGKIEQFNVVEGSKLSKGQIIARLSDRDAQLKVRRAQNELEQMEKLFSLGGVSRTKLDEARLNMDVAQTELDKTRIVATRDGILGNKAADVGEFVNPQRKIGTLVAIRNVVVEVGIIEKQVDKVYPGQKILVTVDAYPGNVFEGTIETLSPIIEESKTSSIRAKIPNKDNLLLPGMFARAKIIIYEVDDAMTVPNDALVKTTGGFQVFTVNKDNLATPVDVEIGHISTEFTQINAGLNPGDIVISQKPPELKAGSKVKIIEPTK